MPRWKVNHSYSAGPAHERVGPWEPGQEMELSDEEAARINADSPGTLSPADEPAEATPAAEDEPVTDDAAPAVPAQEAADETEPEEATPDETGDEDEPQRAKSPARDRQHRGGRNRSG